METKIVRQARREERKAKRKLRSSKFKQVIELARNIPEPEDVDFLELPKEKFNLYWPALRSVLDFIADLRFTGVKFDLAIERIINIGDKMKNGTANSDEGEEFIDKMQNVWKFARVVASVTTLLTDDKTDEVIEKIIAVGDWITSYDEE